MLLQGRRVVFESHDPLSPQEVFIHFPHTRHSARVPRVWLKGGHVAKKVKKDRDVERVRADKVKRMDKDNATHYAFWRKGKLVLVVSLIDGDNPELT